METLTGEVSKLLKSNGAGLVGVASVDRFEGAPRGHHPRDFIPGAKSVVSFGAPMLHFAVNWERHLRDSDLVAPENRKEVLQNYLAWDLLDMMSLRLASFLENQGYRSLFFPQHTRHRPLIWEKVFQGRGLFSHRHAAVRAGLGEFGLNNLVITPQYGPRIRFNSVITEAELTPSPLLEAKSCLGEKCSICVKACSGPISLRPEPRRGMVQYARANRYCALPEAVPGALLPDQLHQGLPGGAEAGKETKSIDHSG
jgi:epoxyqueuosine reductase QueG